MSEREYAVRPNKSEIKREIKMLNALGKELIGLPDGALKKIPLSDSMRSAIDDGKRFSRGALQRQLRRIAGLMQYEDVAAIQMELQRQKQPSREQTQRLHQLENWRDRLAAGDDNLLTELLDQFAGMDRQHIRQLVRNAQHEVKNNKPPRASRSLFKYLSEFASSSVSGDAAEMQTESPQQTTVDADS